MSVATSDHRSVTDERATPSRHPATAPWGSLVERLGLDLPDSAVTVMSGVGYLEPPGRARVYERAFGFLASLGFSCESFASADAHLALRALRRQWDLMKRRWKPLPVLTVLPQLIPGTDREVEIPAELADLDDDGVSVRSVLSVTRLDLGEYLGLRRAVHGHAAPVPSMRAILAPARLDLAGARRRAILRELRRMRDSDDGIASLEAFVASDPSATEIARYRCALEDWLLGPAGNRRGYRDALARESALAGLTSTALLLARSAELHEHLLLGEDGALREIAHTERAALEAVGR